MHKIRGNKLIFEEHCFISSIKVFPKVYYIMAQLAWARFSFYSIGYDGVSLSQASTELNCGVVLLFPRLSGKIFAIFGHVPYWDRGCKVCMPKFSFLGFSPSLPQPSPPSTTLPCPPPPSLALPCSPPPTPPSLSI